MTCVISPNKLYLALNNLMIRTEKKVEATVIKMNQDKMEKEKTGLETMMMEMEMNMLLNTLVKVKEVNLGNIQVKMKKRMKKDVCSHESNDMREKDQLEPNYHHCK